LRDVEVVKSVNLVIEEERKAVCRKSSVDFKLLWGWLPVDQTTWV